MKFKQLLLTVLFLLSIMSATAQTTKEPMRAMLYSAAVPGGGQFYTGSYIKAGVVIGLQSFLVSSAIYNYQQMRSYRADNDTVNETLYHDALRSDYWWMGITVGLSMADAYVDAHLYNFEQEKAKVHLKFEDKLLKVEYRF